MKLLTDSLHRIAYSTDASIYSEMPMAVAYPESEDDIRWLLAEAERRHTHLIPRAAGTSIAGQVVGSGIVMDISRYMNRILEINAAERWVRVQPGVVRDELNMALKPYGLFFSPETSTSNRCCIGGMVGNNSCGTHSLIYGSTRHHVLALRVMLTDGTVHTFTNHTTYSPADTGLRGDILRQLHTWQHDPATRQLLTSAFPDTTIRRRSCGYALDEALAGQTLDIPALLTGSEGTLAIVTEITLSLDPLPPAHTMLVCAHLDDLDKSWPANLIALRHQPTAVELLDGRILELCRGNIEADKNRFFVQGEPAAIVVVEFHGDDTEALNRQAAAFEADLAKQQMSYACTRVYDGDVARVWALRKAGLGVLTSTDADAKPVGVIEDTAVAPERMQAYMHDFRAMMARLNLDCVFYGHISTGELHLRPVLNLRLQKDKELFRQVATETARLVKKHHGSLSGEHGDGRLRGEFIPLMYGKQVYELFRQLKRTWDPQGLLNIGKIVDTPPMDSSLRYDPEQPLNHPEREALLRQLDRCNGSGDCRKSNLIGGTLCPAYKVSHDELWSTRARANILRYAQNNTEQSLINSEPSLNDAVKEVLSSCLACKGCRSECPSNVDMTRIRSEILQQQYDTTHVPFRTWMIAHMAYFQVLGSLVPSVYNFFATNRLTSSLLKHLMHFAAQRRIPTLSRHTMRYLIAHNQQSVTRNPSPVTRHRVYLFADEFTNYQEAEIGLTFANLLRHLDYEVIVPKHVESGRAAISKGCLRLASRFARKNIQFLKDIITDDTPLVGIEPSCILSFRDEYPRLVPAELKRDAETLARNCLLYDEFLLREIQRGHISTNQLINLSTNIPTPIYLHGHCHQKALVGIEKTAELLRLIPNTTLHVIPSGCCGMAGSFGYEQTHYDTSIAIAEMVLAPAVRQAEPNAVICAPGTSCRQQILDTTARHALHPIQLLAKAFGIS